MKKITEGFRLSTIERRSRNFSRTVKEKIVRDIESRKISLTEACRVYEVSRTAVYQWMGLYSRKEKPIRTIVETKSDTSKILSLQKRIADLERLVGQKQVQIEYQEKMINLAEETYKIDIKKKLDGKP